MIEKLRNLSPRAEFLVVVLCSFAYPTASSLTVLVRHIHTFDLSTPRVLRGIEVELLSLAVIVAFLKIRGWQFRRFGFQLSFSNIAAGLSLFIYCILAYWLAVIAVNVLLPSAFKNPAIHFARSAPAAITLVFILINSVFEELTVAGYVINALSPRGAALSITASTLIRLSYHLYQGPLAFVSILPLGLMFAAVYWHWRNLWPLLVAHTATNLFAVFVFSQTA